ncbi:MAG: response regulator [Terriglobia bacterium]
METVRILIADDHDLVRRGIRALLQDHPTWEVCGEAATGRDAIDKAKRLKPDIVVLDANMPEVKGVEAAREILKQVPGVEVLILTMDESPQLMRDLLEAGVRGYVFKSDFDRDLVDAITSLSQRHPYFTSRVSQMMLEDYQKGKIRSRRKTPPDSLTPRQCEVIRLLASGKTNKEVAAALGISVKTAETHRAVIMRKLSFHSFSELVRYAVSHNLTE